MNGADESIPAVIVPMLEEQLHDPDFDLWSPISDARPDEMARGPVGVMQETVPPQRLCVACALAAASGLVEYPWMCKYGHVVEHGGLPLNWGQSAASSLQSAPGLRMIDESMSDERLAEIENHAQAMRAVKKSYLAEDLVPELIAEVRRLRRALQLSEASRGVRCVVRQD